MKAQKVCDTYTTSYQAATYRATLAARYEVVRIEVPGPYLDGGRRLMGRDYFFSEEEVSEGTCFLTSKEVREKYDQCQRETKLTLEEAKQVWRRRRYSLPPGCTEQVFIEDLKKADRITP